MISLSEAFEPRGHDLHGSGHFGAPRGNRTHKGQDYQIQPGQPFLAPFDCILVRFGFVYAHDLKYRLLEVHSIDEDFPGYKAKLMYLEPAQDDYLNRQFVKFEPIGITQNIAEKYPGITPHVHLELYDQNNELLNPINYI